MARIVVTGSNSGFGRAIVEGFVRRGDDVVATMRRTEAGSDLERDRADGTGSVRVVELDVTDARSRREAVRTIIADHGTVDTLVNNAGFLHIGSVEDTSPEITERIYATNLFGPVELSRQFLPHMREQRAGRIVNVTAIGAVLCTPYLSAYCATKHALDAVSSALDLEVRPFGIRVSSVLPGAFRTEIFGNQPASEDSDVYRLATETFRAGLADRIEGSSSDLRPVVEAVLEAATAVSPEPRYLVGGPDHLGPLVLALNEAHVREAERLGLN